jgi:hypothetical protein
VAIPASRELAGPLLGQQHHGTVQADVEHLVDVGDIGVGPGVQHKRAVAAEARL